MIYRYLTRSYVDWLGLDLIAIRPLRSAAVVSAEAEGWSLNPARSVSYITGVIHDGALYEREPDGLAYARLPQ